MKKSWKFTLLFAVSLVLPFFFYPIFLAKLLCYGLFACSFNFLFSKSGLLSFGHAAFWGLGAYATALLLKAGVPLEGALLVTIGAALIYGLVLGLCSIKRQGIYFSMVTLAFAQIFYFWALKASWSSGEDGLQAIPRLSILPSFINLESSLGVYYFILFFTAIGFAILYALQRSSFAFSLDALKQNPVRALSLGTNIHKEKMIALVISGVLSALAGSLKVFLLSQATLEDLHWHLSGTVVLMALLGGVETFWGPLIGAVLLISIQDQLAGLGSWILMIQGIVFILCVLFLPKGLGALLKKTNS